MTDQTIDIQPASEVRRPNALPPSASVLARLPVERRELLSRLLEEAVEYIDNAEFHKNRQPAKKLVGSGDIAPRPWCNAVVTTPGAVEDRIAVEPWTHTAAEEQTLFLRLNYARFRMSETLNAARGRRLTGTEASDLLAWHDRSEQSRNEIVQSNMPLVLAMAKRARLGNIDYAELISEGNMALLRSVDKFDCARGFKFSTYACRAILKSFSRVAIRASRYRARFPTEFDPTLERSDHVEHVRDGVEIDCTSELKEILQKNRADLSEIEHRVLAARFALDALPVNGESPLPKTLEQVGALIGVTKERVRQIQNKALQKLRAALEDSILAA